MISVTRFGNLYDFGQLFKATILGDFCKCVKSIIFPVNSFFGNFYRHLAIFSGHTGNDLLTVTF